MKDVYSIGIIFELWKKGGGGGGEKKLGTNVKRNKPKQGGKSLLQMAP
jgi:hypothetical protein